MLKASRPVFWVKAARKTFERFPAGARERIVQALDIATEGRMATITKPMKGLGSGVFEIALKYRSDAYRVVYAVQLGDMLWVVHSFQKKSTTGIKTSKGDIDVIRSRLKQLKEMNT